MSYYWTLTKLLFAYGIFKLNFVATDRWSVRILRGCDLPGYEHKITIVADTIEGRRP